MTNPTLVGLNYINKEMITHEMSLRLLPLSCLHTNHAATARRQFI